MSLHEKDQNQHLEHVPLQFPEHVMTNEFPGGAQRGGGGREGPEIRRQCGYDLQDEVQQVDALTHFHAPNQSLTSLSQRALKHQGPLAPALDSKRSQLLKRTAELRSKAREVDACLEVLTHSCTCRF